MRRAAHIDKSQPAIVAALRAIGASVQSLAPVGQGCPDILAGYKGVNVLIECKTVGEGHDKLNALQTEWHATWGGQVSVVRTPEEAQTEVIRIATALDAVGQLRAALGVTRGFSRL